jgi:hypothetical protein
MNELVNSRGQNMRLAHTENAYDVLSSSNLCHNGFITFLQRTFLSLKNLDRRFVHNVDDISQPFNILEGKEIDHKPAESRGADLYEGRKKSLRSDQGEHYGSVAEYGSCRYIIA